MIIKLWSFGLEIPTWNFEMSQTMMKDMKLWKCEWFSKLIYVTMPKLDILKSKTRDSNIANIVKMVPCHSLLMDIYNFTDIKSTFLCEYCNQHINRSQVAKLCSVKCECHLQWSSNGHLVIDVLVTIVFGEYLFNSNDWHWLLWT